MSQLTKRIEALEAVTPTEDPKVITVRDRVGAVEPDESWEFVGEANGVRRYRFARKEGQTDEQSRKTS